MLLYIIKEIPVFSVLPSVHQSVYDSSEDLLFCVRWNIDSLIFDVLLDNFGLPFIDYRCR